MHSKQTFTPPHDKAIHIIIGALFVLLFVLIAKDYCNSKALLKIASIEQSIKEEKEVVLEGVVTPEKQAPVVEAAVEPEPTPEELLKIKEHKELKLSMRKGFLLHESRADKFSRWILDAHQQTQVPVGFITALIASESSFRYNVVSSVGAIGPAQVRPDNWQTFCKLDLTDPAQNILCGAKALDHLYKSSACKQDWACAFAHYNVGRGNLLSNRYPGAADRYISRITTKLDMIPTLWPEGLSLNLD